MINNFILFFKKRFSWLLLLSVISLKLHSQQVTKVDCCTDVGTKATIIINSNNNATSTTTNPYPSNNTIVSNGFNFTLSASSNTSAGVYNTSGVLLRTLWSGVRHDAGCYTVQWDGLLDNATAAPYGSYTIKVQTNNVQYTWEGGIGNTSDVTTGPFIHGGSHVIDCMTFVGTQGYYSMAGSEGTSSQHRFSTSNPLRKNFADAAGTTIDAYQVCTDGNYVYWAGAYNGQNPRSSGFFATRISDNSLVNFSSGTTVNYASITYSLGDIVSLPDVNGNPDFSGEMRGMAVGSSYVFISRPGLNRLDVCNKNTAQLVQTITINGAYSLACTADNKIWVSSSTSPFTVRQYAINNDGTLTTTGLTVTGGNNTGIAISPVNGELAVADDTTEQIKFYDISGALVYILGQAGGYATSPAVTYDKFMFTYPFLGASQPYIAYQPDGSFWFSDAGNYRNLHYGANKAYINQIAFIPSSRNISCDINNPARVFSNYLEYNRNYGLPLDNGTNGSWKLQNNWLYPFDRTNTTEYDGFFNVFTLSNGKTFTAYQSNDSRNYQVWELRSPYLAFTGITLQHAPYTGGFSIRQDGSYEHANYFANAANTQVIGNSVVESLLTGFDNNGYPVWGNEYEIAHVTTALGAPFNAYGHSTNTTPVAQQKRVIFWNGGNFMAQHLGSVKRNESTAEWQTSFGTNNTNIGARNNYWRGDYPRDGSIDAANDKNPDICPAIVSGDQVFWNDHGEFWKASGTATQVNIWNHYNAATGLLVGNFGITGYDGAYYGAGAPMMAGNAFSTSLNKVGNDYYIYHCDESYHSFIHSWKVTGVNTINVQTIPVTVTGPITKVIDPADMMAGLPYRAINFYSSNGWTVYPATQDGASYYPSWFVATSLNSNAKNDIDLTFYEDGGGGVNDHYLMRDLGTNNTNNWTLSGYIYFNSATNQIYLETLDAAGKILTRQANSGPPTVNGTAMGTDNGDKLHFGIYPHWQPFIIKNVNGTVTFQYFTYPAITLSMPFESGGNFNTISKFRIRAFGSGSGNAQGAVKGLRFVAGTGI